MANWNRRPRRNYRQKAATSPSRWYQDEFPPPDWQDNVPSWEKKFCASVGSVPWRKIVVTKKFMASHSNIIDWDDSASEEAFNNAKSRFWAQINSLPCDIRLPDQDIYVDKIDWHPYIDPELVSALDRDYVCPDEASKHTQNDTKTNTKQQSSGNPWDHGGLGQPNDALNISPTSWGQWGDKSEDLKCGVNPWEQSLKSNGGKPGDLKCGDSPWEIKPEGLECEGNPWKQSLFKSDGAMNEAAWGDLRDNSRDRTWMGKNAQGWGQGEKCTYHLNGPSMAERSWRRCSHGQSNGGRQGITSGNQYCHLHDWNGGVSRKRQGSVPTMTRYKNFRIQG